VNAAINRRAKLASEKLHCADYVYNPPIITAVTQNSGNGLKSWHALNHGIQGDRDFLAGQIDEGLPNKI